MKNLIRRMTAISLAVIALMTAVSFWIGGILPPDIQIAIHWGLNGEANGFASKTIGLSAMPVTALIVMLLFAFLPQLEPRRGNLLSSRQLYAASWAVVLFILAAAHAHIVATATGFKTSTSSFVLMIFPVVLIVLGNFLTKSKSMFFMGVRTPWTLSSEEVWFKTHRFTGRFFMLTGAMVLLAFIAGIGDRLVIRAMIVAIVAGSLAAVVYSWLLWHREQGRAGKPRSD